MKFGISEALFFALGVVVVFLVSSKISKSYNDVNMKVASLESNVSVVTSSILRNQTNILQNQITLMNVQSNLHMWHVLSVQNATNILRNYSNILDILNHP